MKFPTQINWTVDNKKYWTDVLKTQSKFDFKPYQQDIDHLELCPATYFAEVRKISSAKPC